MIEDDRRTAREVYEQTRKVGHLQWAPWELLTGSEQTMFDEGYRVGIAQGEADNERLRAVNHQDHQDNLKMMEATLAEIKRLKERLA